mmetsp:Transcript_19838/g.26689  ORF Transcript_19838/g.26689 Transcript_19838/m.26689 type:complete len:102 (-) Transcript_19838:412-717(-)
MQSLTARAMQICPPRYMHLHSPVPDIEKDQAAFTILFVSPDLALARWAVHPPRGYHSRLGKSPSNCNLLLCLELSLCDPGTHDTSGRSTACDDVAVCVDEL